jgi:hypothetical protein
MTPRRNSNRTYRRGPSFVDCALALSVISGLVFVTVRMMSMPTPPAMAETAVVKTEPSPLAPDAADIKTP